ncbi:MAG: hypothetical protein ACRBFS_07055 [Aureispira sp.]
MMTRRRTLKTIFFLGLALFFMTCGNAPVKEEATEAFELGTTLPGHYHNAYFDLDIYFDPTWSVQKKEQIEWMEEVGENLLLEEKDSLKTVFNASTVNTAYLLTVFKHPLEANVDYNPNFIALVENVRVFSDIETGVDYLFQVQKLLKQTALDYQFEAIYEQKIGAKVFYVLEVTATYMGTEIKQSYWCTIDKGFCLSFILSYHSEKEKEELMQIINKIKM